PESDRELAESLFDAEQVVAGRLVQIAEAQEYERPGQLVFGAGGTKATAALAYSAEIRVDSTLVGRSGPTVPITFFAPRGAAIPRQDTTAIWILHRRVLWHLKECAERQSVTSTACPSDNGLALDSNSDIRPLAEWPRLRALVGPDRAHGNLVARYRGTGTGGRPIVVFAHLDVVPARRTDWSVDPFTFLEKDGYFYGRGTTDDKVGDAILVVDFIRLKRARF